LTFIHRSLNSWGGRSGRKQGDKKLEAQELKVSNIPLAAALAKLQSDRKNPGKFLCVELLERGADTLKQFDIQKLFGRDL